MNEQVHHSTPHHSTRVCLGEGECREQSVLNVCIHECLQLISGLTEDRLDNPDNLTRITSIQTQEHNRSDSTLRTATLVEKAKSDQKRTFVYNTRFSDTNTDKCLSNGSATVMNSVCVATVGTPSTATLDFDELVC
jgi:hypothetical protein